MTYLVTGGTGFIGSYVVRELTGQGEKVVAFDWMPQGGMLSSVLGERAGEVPVVSGNIANSWDILKAANNNQVEAIIHLAGLLREASDTNPPLATEVGCQGVVNVLETARLLRLRRVVLASSIHVFGGYTGGELILDDTPPRPVNVYGICKVFSESMARYYFDTYGVDTIGLRFTMVHGYGRLRGAPLQADLIGKAALGVPATAPFGDGVVDTMDVSDAARAAVLACRAPRTRTRVFNMSGERRKVSDIVEYVRKLLPQAQITVQPGIYRFSPEVQTGAIREELGFIPQKSTEETTRDTINMIRRERGLAAV